MKNHILLDNYYFVGKLEAQIKQFVDYSNNERYHESLNNLTPADVFYGRGVEILQKRREIKLKTIALRKKKYYNEMVKN